MKKLFLLPLFLLLPQVALADNYTWTQHSFPGVGGNYTTYVASSADGTKLVIDRYNNGIYISTDSGVTWTTTSARGHYYHGIASSANGMTLVNIASATAGGIGTSIDGGVTWTEHSPIVSWTGITTSADGTRSVAVWYNSSVGTPQYIYTSTNSGATWTAQTGGGLHFWRAVTSSADGMKVAAVDVFGPTYGGSGGYIYTSTDAGVTMTQRTGSGAHAWKGITSSADGTKLAAVADYIYTSTDSGVTWTQQTGSGARLWFSITSSSDGTKLAAVADYIYISSDSGVTWTQEISPGSRAWSGIASSADGSKLAATYRGASADPILMWTGLLSLPPTCTVSLSPTTIAYGGSGSTLSYSSSNATSFNITNVGPVAPNITSSATVYSAGSYTGTVWDAIGNAYACSPNGGTLTVTPPPLPTATISASSTSIQVGQSTKILATFAAGPGDTLTADNIDSPVGTGLGATTNPDAGKTITFTPASAGTYTFYARAQTSYFTSWATYNSVTVTVQAPCTLDGTTLQSGQSGTFYSAHTPPSGQVCPSISQSRTCTNGVLSGSSSYQYSSCTCAPAYTCSGQTIQYTNSSCQVSNITTCVAPAFCSAGSSTCLYPSPAFNSGANGLTGHLQLAPSLVHSGGTTAVYWNVSNVSSCTVSGNNGDNWNMTSSPAGGKTSAPIIQQTTYTLACTGLDGSPVNESKTVNILPVFKEQ